MNGHDEQDGAETSKRPRIRFSLLAMLLFVTLACLALAWIVRPRQVVVEALFQISSKEAVLLGNAPVGDAQAYDMLQRSQLVLLKSHFVLQAAARDPGISSLPILASIDDPVDWLQKNLEAEFLQNSEILSIRLRGPEAYAQDLQSIVNAVTKAYEIEVVYNEKQRRLLTRDAKARTLSQLGEELGDKLSDLQALKRELQEHMPDTSGSSEIRLKQIEIDVLESAYRPLFLSLECDDMNAHAPERIRMIQSATVRQE